MRSLRANAPAARGERGEVSFIGLAMLAAVAAAGYLAWVWVPIYADHQDVERIVRETGNAAVKERDDHKLLAAMLAKVRQLRSVEVEQDGKVSRQPVIDVTPADVVWEREGTALRVAFSYTRELVYPWIERRQERVMSVDLKLDVSPADWAQKPSAKFWQWGSK